MNYQIVWKQYRGSVPVKTETIKIQKEETMALRALHEFPCRIRYTRKKDKDSITFRIQAELLNNIDEPFSLTFEMETEPWLKETYVFFPGAVYNGNRMKSEKLSYPPFHAGSGESGWDPVITDIPHLSANGDEHVSTRIQLCSGDMATPAMGYYKDDWQEGVFIFSRHFEQGEYTGFAVEERDQKAVFSVSCPAVREKTKYFCGEHPDGSGFYPDNGYESDDEGIFMTRGEKLEMEVKIYTVHTRGISRYFEKFNELKDVMEKGDAYHCVPFSKAYEAIKEKYTKQSFTGVDAYPFLIEDGGEAKEQALSNLCRLRGYRQRDNGWFVPADAGKTDDAVLQARKAGDLMYILLKQMMYLKENGEAVEDIDQAVKAQADAFVRYFKKNGEISQFLDVEKEIPVQKGTTGAAIVPAALALASVYFDERVYLEAAEALGKNYLENYLRKGMANGGPEDICQAPDSESAFALLESYVELYEISGKEQWLRAAKDAFELAWTWVMSYDFRFPKYSTADRMRVRSRGTVLANVQNKYAAPGICMLSGNSMLKLYRFTGNERYLQALKRISHAIPQFVSLEDRPVTGMGNRLLPSGTVNDRVQISDWEGKEKVGEFSRSSDRTEVSMLLTYVEVPGIYLDRDKKKAVCFDHVMAEVMGEEAGAIRLRVTNPTAYEATVSVMADSREQGKMLGKGYFAEMKRVTVPAGESVVVCV